MFNTSKALRERLDALERKYRELEEDHAKLKRHVDLEWEELKDKVHRWMQRTGARDRVEAKAAAQQPPPPQQMFPNADPASARILARRARLRVPPLPTDAGEDQGAGVEEAG